MENRNFFVCHPICLKFGIGSNFEMLITKHRDSTGEVTDRFNEITMFAMALFRQKVTEFFTKLLQSL